MILAAGLGTRLRPITYEIPKPMVPVLGTPVMAHIVELLRRHGFVEVIANLHHFPDAVRDHFGDGSDHGIELSYSYEEALLGTAGGVRNVAGFFGDESFLVISGDALTDIDLSAMRQAHESHDGIATLATRPVDDTSRYGVVVAGSDGRVQGFQEKPDPAEALSDLCNCGIYMFRPEIFDHFPPEEALSKIAEPDSPPGFADWAMDVFPELLDGDVPFFVHRFERYWNDVGSLDEYRQSNFDALAGAVEVTPGVPEVAPRVFAGSPLDGVEVEAPVFVGVDCRLGTAVELRGPVAIGDGCAIGDGATLRETVVLGGSEVPPDSILIGAIVGTK
jgi:mannose-1-phosphate guanylyltransferase/mannose-1-phosphate guanylyltransferase/phosphomannomutase